MSARHTLSPSLAALMSAAAALVSRRACAIATGASNSDSRVSYRFNDYDEDAFAPGTVIGSPDRYRVFSQQFQLDTRVGSNARTRSSPPRTKS